MMKAKHSALIALALLASVLPATAQNPVYTLKRTPTVGSKHQYELTMDLKITQGGQEFAIAVSGKSEQKVEAVDADGSYTENHRQYDTHLVVAGQDQDQPESNSQIRIDKEGNLLDYKSEMSGPFNFRRHYLTQVFMPSAPVAVGATWTKHIDSSDKGTRKMDIKYTLLGVEKIGDEDYYKVKIESKELEGENPSGFDGWTLISAKDGHEGHSEGTMTNMPLPESMPQDVSGKLKITLKS